MSAEVPGDGPPPLPADAMLAPGFRVVGRVRRGRDFDVYDLWSEDRACRCIGKTIRPDRLQRRGLHSGLLREGRLLLRLTHPHIVRGYEIVAASPPVVIVETLPGETLDHLIDRQRRRLAATDVAQLGVQLCSAIGYLHRHGYLHLDLKPSNIIAAQGMAKVLDLSLARQPGRTNVGLGTRGYMSPEQALGEELTPASDVWGIGATLYEAATGEPACDAGPETMTANDEWEPCRPESVGRSRRLPQPLAGVIDRCLSMEPADRPTLPELTAALENVLRR